jgi:inner membrane protein
MNGLYLYDKKLNHYPVKAEITGDLQAEIRKKGIFEIPFYNAAVKIKGKFNIAKDRNYKYLRLKVSDKFPVEIKKFLWNNKPLSRYDYSRENNIIALRIPREKGDGTFFLSMNIHGLDKFHIIPFSKNTKIALTSNWSNPNFTGAYLPGSRKIDSKGFSAAWNITLQEIKINDYSSAFGVNLFVPVDSYQQTERSVKYAILFISLTFLTFFLIEIMSNIKIHPLQYLLVGFALTLFYLLLLSLSEHVNFILSYLLATMATITLISTYSIKILQNKTSTNIMIFLLTLLYTFLFTLLQLEEYALLMGSLALFIILAVVMYITRDVDWYSITESAGENIELKSKV